MLVYGGRVMKKVFVVLIILLFACLLCNGCSNKSADVPEEELVVINAGEDEAEAAAEEGSVKPDDAGTVKPEDEGQTKPLGLE